MALTPEEIEKLTKALQKAEDNLNEARAQGLATRKQILALEIELQKALIQTAKATGESEDVLESYRGEIRRLTEVLNDLTEAEKKQKESAAAVDQSYKLLTDSIFGLSGKFEKLIQVTELGADGFLELGKTFVAGAKSGALVTDALRKISQELVYFGFAADESIAQFRAQTGAGDEFNETIRDVAIANIAAGASFDDVASAVGSLKNEFTDFTYLSQQQQEAIAQTTVQLNKLGFSFGTQAKIVQTATQTLGMDVDEANDLLIDLASTARSLGVDVDTLGAQFEANKDFIVRFGEDGQEVFEELAVAAKALGTELGTLIEVTEKFKTFDSAAEAVGRLNAILSGPYLNSIDLLNASYEDPIEGIKLLREGFEQAGVSIEDVSGAQLEAFAAALGLSTSKTKELLGATNEDLEIQRMNQEQLAAAAEETQKIMDRLSNAFRQTLIAAKPLIDNAIIPMIDLMGSFAKFIGDNTAAIKGVIDVSLIAAGAVALMFAPVTGGGSLAAFAALAAKAAGIAGIATGLGSAIGLGYGTSQTATATPRFEQGGTIMSQQAIVHPGEMLITGGQGSEVISKKDFKDLIDAMKNSQQGNQQIAVYVGQEKIDELVVKGLNSEKARSAFSPYTNA